MVLTEVNVGAEVEVEVESGTGVEPAVEAVVVLDSEIGQSTSLLLNTKNRYVSYLLRGG